MNDKTIASILKSGINSFSVGTKAHEDLLLDRIFANVSFATDEGVEINDDALEFLAAAGEFAAQGDKTFGMWDPIPDGGRR